HCYRTYTAAGRADLPWQAAVRCPGIPAPMNRADLLRSASLACGAVAVSEGAPATPSDAAAPNPADAALDALLAADWADLMRRHPITASLSGDRAGDDRWDDQSQAALAAEGAHQRAALATMERIGRDRLSEPA